MTVRPLRHLRARARAEWRATRAELSRAFGGATWAEIADDLGALIGLIVVIACLIIISGAFA